MEEIIIFTVDDDIVDIEWFFINKHPVPHGRKYRYKVDKIPFITSHHKLSRETILTNAGKDPKEFILREKIHGTWVTINEGEDVDLSRPGVEKFKTLENDHTEGDDANQSEKSLRRDFSLLEEDIEYLESLGLEWEAVEFDTIRWVLVHQYPLPLGYNVNQTSVAVRLTANYPAAALDMLYFFPALSRTDGKPIGGLTEFKLDGKTFQQWSRHRTAANPWRNGIDNLSTHIPMTEVWLAREFKKNPSDAVSN
jgi:Prokaryotic E2 family E/Multiubiquitin